MALWLLVNEIVRLILFHDEEEEGKEERAGNKEETG